MNAFIRRNSQLSCSAHRPHYHGDEAVCLQGPFPYLVSCECRSHTLHFSLELQDSGWGNLHSWLYFLWLLPPPPHKSVQLRHPHPHVTGLLWTRPLCTLPSLLYNCLFAIYICWSEPHLSEARDCLQSLIPRGAGKVLGGVSVYPVETRWLEQALWGRGACGCALNCIWSFWEESWMRVQSGTRPGRMWWAWENPVDQLPSSR